MRTGDGPLSSALPRLAVVYDPLSVAPLPLAAAARGAWQTVWVLDRDIPGAADAVRLLDRLGPIADVTGRDLADAAAVVAAERPDGIVAYADNQLVATARLAAKLGLPFHSEETAYRLTNKAAQRAALRDADIPTPGHWPLAALPDERCAAEFAQQVRYPVVVKPQAGGGSQDTYRAADAGQLRTVFRALADRPAMELIVEEYLPDGWPRAERPVGDYVSVESVVRDGCISHIAISGRYPLTEPFRECGAFVPSTLDGGDEAEVLALAARAARALDVTVGCLHTEIKLTPDGPRIIEVNGRVGGGGIPASVQRVTGFSIFRAAGMAALGTGELPGGILPADGVAFFWTQQPPVWARGLESVGGVDDVARLDGVLDVTLNRRPGDALDWRNGSYEYVLAVQGVVRTHAEMHDLVAQIADRLKITYR